MNFSSLPLHFIHYTNTMTKKESRTTITISRAHYAALQNLGGKRDTFDDIIGNLLKSAKALDSKDV